MSVRRTLLPSLALAALLVASCGGGGGGGGVSSVPSSPPTGTIVIGEAEIGPDGGTLLVAGEAGLMVPPGAVTAPTQFRILRQESDADIPSAFPVYRFEPGSIDLTDVSFTVSIPVGAALSGNGGGGLAIFRRASDVGSWSVLTQTTFDPVAQVATASTQRLGEMVVWSGILHRLFTQPHGFIDPSEPAFVESIGSVEVLSAEGSVQRQVGRGSLASFWNSSQTENIVILHGVFGSPLDFLGPEDLVENLALGYDNVVLYSFPSARGVAYAANRLYDQIQANRKPGFGCRIVGHSLGALVGRYLLERSHSDPMRAGYAVDDPPLVNEVDKIILMAPPNAGAPVAAGPLTLLEPLLLSDESYLLQSAEDLSGDVSSLPVLMNASYVDNATRYHIIYGDLGSGTDGVVPVSSVLALPLGADETATLYAAQHDDLHRLATSLGVAVWMGAVLQAQ